MKQIILTFFITVLIILLIKNKMETFSVRGCHVHNIAKPTKVIFIIVSLVIYLIIILN